MRNKGLVGGCIVTLVLAVLVAAAGCCSDEPVRLGANDNGQQIELAVGQQLSVSLESNPTTGFRWEALELDQAVLRQEGEPTFKAESDLLGAAGTETLSFEALRPGQAVLQLVYRRSWETGVPPLETFECKVVVH